MEVGSPEYQAYRHEQLYKAYDRIIASYQNRLHDLEFDIAVLRDNLKRLSQAEKQVLGKGVHDRAHPGG